MKPKVKYPIKNHWDAWAKQKPYLVDYVKTILDEEISQEAFSIAYMRITKNISGTTPSKSRQIYKFLTENNWIKKG